MRKLLLLPVLAITMVAAAPAQAEASAINECGDFRTYLPVGNGGVVKVIDNITTRNVSCSDARSFVRRAWNRGLPYHSGPYTVRGWKTYHVRHRTYNEYRTDLRFTRTNHVIRFQAWSDYC